MSDYITTDLGLAGVLLCSDFELKGMKRVNNKGHFQFENTPELGQFVEDYFAGRIQVNPIVYSGALRTLKNYLFNAR